MRILTSLTFYHPHWTGLTVYAHAIAAGLVARGHEVTVVTTRHDPALAPTATIDGVRVVRVPVAGRLSRSTVAPGLVPAVARRMRGADVVHVHTPMAESAPLAAAARALRRPLVITHQGDLTLPAGAANRVIERGANAVMGVGNRLASAITCHSADYVAASAFLRPVRDRVVAIPPPTTLRAPDLEAAAAWRAQLGLTGVPVVGFAGRFVQEKGFDVLFRALEPLVAAVPDVRLVFAGEVDMGYEAFWPRVRHLLGPHEDRLLRLGLVPRERLPELYALFDVLAMPSRSDCFGAVQTEALRCGTPLVTSDIPGAREVVARTGRGRLVPAEDPAGLAAALAAVLADPQLQSLPAALPAFYAPEASIDAYEALLAGC